MTLTMGKLAERDGITLGAETLRLWLWVGVLYADMYTMYQSLAERSDKPGLWKLGILTVPV